ncbi:hypothetical protein [Bradyrhizobium japonicum]|uniref:hypothetical protein n=1 Tax=Bradyrhizobium japonicum TaxID=375 RepID=UPI002167C930|nr:hypothetical protein [Bradyrhizobium japonicum]MCS4126112.1 hypothetical protein [Bradyrhizobium japonicum]
MVIVTGADPRRYALRLRALHRCCSGRRRPPISWSGGIPTEALLALVAGRQVQASTSHSIVQSQCSGIGNGFFIDARRSGSLDGNWFAFHLAPLVERMSVVMKQIGPLVH